MTVPVPRKRDRAELEHPPWCDVANCLLELLGVGGRHQSREITVVDDSGTPRGSVVLQQTASGRLMVGMFARSHSWDPHVARRIGEALIAQADAADAEQRAD